MSDEELRERIADAIVDAWRVAPDNARVLEMARWFADAALPAIRAHVAEQLRAAADQTIAYGGAGANEWLRRRADGLDDPS